MPKMGFNVRIDGDMRADLEKIQARRGPDVTLADIVREALREKIERELGDEPETARGEDGQSRT